MTVLPGNAANIGLEVDNERPDLKDRICKECRESVPTILSPVNDETVLV